MNTRNLFFVAFLVLAALCAVAADGKTMLDKMKDAVNQAKATVEDKIGSMGKKEPTLKEAAAEKAEAAGEKAAAAKDEVVAKAEEAKAAAEEAAASAKETVSEATEEL
eukprot:scaffold1965_cov110-Cylindrotheca_fusiformis.AAC.10